MSVSLECKKIKRTGFLPAFLGGGLFAAAVPMVNMAVRWEIYLSQQGDPLQILLGANWQVMAMLNVLLVVAGTCLLYHTEYADNAMQKMRSLPIRESSVFLGKAVLAVFMCLFTLAIEAGAVAFCTWRWFRIESGFFVELCKSFGYSLLLMLPCVILSLLISQACKNMWASLGIGVVCVFAATTLPADSLVLRLFPFAMPFQTLAGTDPQGAIGCIYGAAAELAALGLAELILIKTRRLAE